MRGISDNLILPEDIEQPRYFSRRAPTTASSSGNLPHWEQADRTVFLTFRLADSLPADKLAQWREEEHLWRNNHPAPWSEDVQLEYDRTFGMTLERWLDAGTGECLMRDSRAAEIVENALRHFDGERYRLYSFTLMPNHVHVVFMPLKGNKLQRIVQTWKSFTAHAINKALARTGDVWQHEYFDRYIRDSAHFERAMRYVARNSPAVRYWTCAS